MKFIGRVNELKILKEAYSSANYEGILIYGRRRIGKSELIKESLKNENCVSLYFECTNVSEESNTEALSELIGRKLNIPTPAFKHFSEALDYLFHYSLDHKIILVIDEYPYLRNKIEGCDSVFQKVIDTYAFSGQMKFILCGSFTSVMQELCAEDNPLHKRLGININLKPMNYYESQEFYAHMSNEDKVKIYAVFGGIPYYNKYIDEHKTVKENIIDLIASTEARFAQDPEITLEKEISKMANANETFLAIARGKTKFSDILNASHVSSSPTLADILKRLIIMDIIKKECPINDETEKKSCYVINDRLSHFYYKYIFPKLSYLSAMNPFDFYDEFIKEDFETHFVPKEFETITKEYLVRKNKEGCIKPTLYKIGKYYYDDAKLKKNGEFDVVTLNENGYDFYEVKFTKEPIDDSIVREEKYQLDNAHIKYNKMGFISKSGFRLSEPNDYVLITLDDIYK